jgi:hypothetical protein
MSVQLSSDVLTVSPVHQVAVVVVVIDLDQYNKYFTAVACSRKKLTTDNSRVVAVVVTAIVLVTVICNGCKVTDWRIDRALPLPA